MYFFTANYAARSHPSCGWREYAWPDGVCTYIDSAQPISSPLLRPTSQQVLYGAVSIGWTWPVECAFSFRPHQYCRKLSFYPIAPEIHLNSSSLDQSIAKMRTLVTVNFCFVYQSFCFSFQGWRSCNTCSIFCYRKKQIQKQTF